MPESVVQAFGPEFEENLRKLLAHIEENRCEHEFGGWREFDDGRGGEQFCQKCGLGAMMHSAWGDI